MPSIVNLEQDSSWKKTAVRIPRSQVKSIAVIGGGASGAIALDSVLKENHFDKITVFERRDKLGGIWCLDEDVGDIPGNVKSGSSHRDIDPSLLKCLKRNLAYNSEKSANSRALIPKVKQERFEKTPSYKGLTTNITEQLMTYSDVSSWTPPGGTIEEDTAYVDGQLVQQYIERYITRNLCDERVLVQTGVTVEDVERIYDFAREIPYYFRLTFRKLYSDSLDELWQEDFDAIIVGTGHYHVPFIPSVKGLSAVEERFPEKVQHSKFFRNGDPYEGKTVIVVGSRASGADLVRIISEKAKFVFQSIRSWDRTKNERIANNMSPKPKIREFVILDSTSFKVVFEDNSEVVDPDYIIYATGYQFSFPYLENLYKESDKQLVQDGTALLDLYQHTFAISDPLLTFVGMPIDGVSFRVFEYQAVLVARYLSGKVNLPNRQEMQLWVENRISERGITRQYHTIGLKDALSYIKTLVQMGRIKNGGTSGREFPVLDEELLLAFCKSKLKKFWDEKD